MSSLGSWTNSYGMAATTSTAQAASNEDYMHISSAFNTDEIQKLLPNKLTNEQQLLLLL